MSQFTELQEKFFSETGICAVNSQGEPDIDYVNWLEAMVENGSSHNSAMDAMREMRAVMNGRGDSVTKVLNCKDILARHQ